LTGERRSAALIRIGCWAAVAVGLSEHFARRRDKLENIRQCALRGDSPRCDELVRFMEVEHAHFIQTGVYRGVRRSPASRERNIRSWMM